MIKSQKIFYYRVKSNETIDDIAKDFNLNKDSIIRNNPDIPLYAGEIVKIERPNYVLHFVGPAESIESIAHMYNISIDKLKNDNQITVDKLYIGQEIKIFDQDNLI